MSAGPARHLDALLDECLDVLGRIEARLADLSEGGGTPQGAEAAGRLRSALREAARAEPGDEPASHGRDSPGLADLPVTASDDCPSCGSVKIGTVESIPGVALGQIEGGHFAWSGDTQVDWNGSETARSELGVTLECASCGGRWIHPALILEGS